MTQIKSYKVFHEGKWHVVEVGKVGELWSVLIDGENRLPEVTFSTEKEAVDLLHRLARASMYSTYSPYPNSNRIGHKVWNENKPPIKLTPEDRFLINPAPEDFLEGGLYLDD